MILLQASMFIFAVWVGVVLIDLIVRRIADKMDNRSLEKDITNNLELNNFKSNANNEIDNKNSNEDINKESINVVNQAKNQNENDEYL